MAKRWLPVDEPLLRHRPTVLSVQRDGLRERCWLRRQRVALAWSHARRSYREVRGARPRARLTPVGSKRALEALMAQVANAYLGNGIGLFQPSWAMSLGIARCWAVRQSGLRGGAMRDVYRDIIGI